MMYRKTLLAICVPAVLALTGCSPEDDTQRHSTISLPGTVWQIEDIDKAGIVDRSMITLQFADAEGTAGSTGCNRYFGSFSLEGEQLIFSQLGSTRRACIPALMDQERRFLEALQGIASYSVDDRELLLLFDSNGAQRLRAVRVDTDPTAVSVARSEPQDLASETVSRFDCDDAGIIEVRFVGPETLQLTRDGMTAILQHVRSGSGARYAGENIEFFNKGDEAMLYLDGEKTDCRRTE